MKLGQLVFYHSGYSICLKTTTSQVDSSLVLMFEVISLTFFIYIYIYIFIYQIKLKKT